MLCVSLANATLPAKSPLIESEIGLLAVLLSVLAVIFWVNQHPVFGRIFKVIPALVFCYFVPTALTALDVIPAKAELYKWVKEFVLPASLLLLTIALDLPGIVRLGPKAGIMLLAGTFGIVIGGPIALFLCQDLVGPDAWRPLSFLAGSWIGGGANAVAVQKSFEASNAEIAPIIIVDVAVANVWTGCLLFLAGRHAKVDSWFKGDTSAITVLETKMQDFQERVARVPSIGDLIIILALGFGLSWACHVAVESLMQNEAFATFTEKNFGDFAWKVVLITMIGVLLSFTPVRNMEGAGASKMGGVMIYLLVACIGAGADFHRLLEEEARWFLLIGAIWIFIHIAVLLTVGWLIRAPFFFIAVGSQANVGGAASAPVVAGAFNPVLAPVGVLLAIAGYVLGTVCGILCIKLCQLVVGG